MGEIKPLTGLRGVGAACVLAYHLCIVFHLHGGHGVFRRGYLAVDMFFVLSGFVLARSHGAAFGTDRSLRLFLGFVALRAARLWPLYAVVTVAVVFAQAMAGTARVWPNEVVANLLMVQAWGLSGSIVVSGWSVSTEWAASLLFPLLALAALHGRRAGAFAMLAAAIVALTVVALLGEGSPHGRRGPLDVYEGWSLLPVVRCLAGTVIGMLLFRATAGAPAAARWLGRGWPAMAAAGAIVGGAWFGVGDAWLYVFITVLVSGLACGGGGVLGRVLGSRWARRGGRLSYAVYLLHLPVIGAFSGYGLAAWWPLVPVVTLAFAIPAHDWFEQPTMAWMRGMRVRATWPVRS